MTVDFSAFNLPNRKPDHSVPAITVTATTEEWAALVAAISAVTTGNSVEYTENLRNAMLKVTDANLDVAGNPHE